MLAERGGGAGAGSGSPSGSRSHAKRARIVLPLHFAESASSNS